MVSAEEIYDYIDGIAPFDTAMSFDNVGLLTGSKDAGSDIVLTALDATAQVIHEAAEKGAGIVVSHHPVIFHPLKSLGCDNPVYLAARYGITVICAHTNLDIAKCGVNSALAEAAGIREEMRFDEHCAIVGTVEGFDSARAYAEHIKERLGLPGLRYTDAGRCRRVLVACGAGGDNVELAVSAGADTVLTGEIKHNHIMYANDHGISVIDIGHFGSESLIIPRLTAMLAARFPQAVFLRAETDSDRVCYL